MGCVNPESQILGTPSTLVVLPHRGGARESVFERGIVLCPMLFSFRRLYLFCRAFSDDASAFARSQSLGDHGWQLDLLADSRALALAKYAQSLLPPSATFRA